jgi:hypothetical protein
VSPAPLTLHGSPPFSAAPWTPRGPAPVSPALISGRPSTRYTRRPCSSGVSGLAVDIFVTKDTRRAAPLPLSSDYAGLVFIASEHDSQEPAERCPFPFPLQLPDIVLVRGGRPGFCTDEEFFHRHHKHPTLRAKRSVVGRLIAGLVLLVHTSGVFCIGSLFYDSSNRQVQKQHTA